MTIPYRNLLDNVVALVKQIQVPYRIPVEIAELERDSFMYDVAIVYVESISGDGLAGT